MSLCLEYSKQKVKNTTQATYLISYAKKLMTEDNSILKYRHWYSNFGFIQEMSDNSIGIPIISDNKGIYEYTAVQLAKDIAYMNKSGLDEACKRILSNKEIIARIMKVCLAEYKNVDIEYITRNCFGDEPEISEFGASSDETIMADERISGMETENILGREGKVIYDIKCKAYIPKTESQSMKTSDGTAKGEYQKVAKLILNIEAQGNFYVGYPLVKRAFYYCCRMISAQKGMEFKGDSYQNLKKVYSIWVCTNVPKRLQNTINMYSIEENHLYGAAKEEVENYDLISVIEICLGNMCDLPDTYSDKEKGYIELLRLLDLIFVEKISSLEKIDRIEKEFGIKMTRETEKEIKNMCNYSEGIFERGKEEGLREGRKNVLIELVKSNMLSLEQAAKSAMMPLEEFVELIHSKV